MKILSISAQKPNSTGSGVFLTELVKSFSHMGQEQAVIAGIYESDSVELPEGVKFYPVYFDTQQLPFKIAGMSDEMPYESTRYSEMTEEMTDLFKCVFKERIREVVEEMQPDIILCHHLYLVTAVTREVAATTCVFGICHNTDLGQMRKTELEQVYIKEQIAELNGIFAINPEQKEEILSIYPVKETKVSIIGTGYNDTVFAANPSKNRKKADIALLFAGKISEKKGVKSLLKSLSYLPYHSHKLTLTLAGGYGNEEEYRSMVELAKNGPYPVTFLGKLSQDALAIEYNESDIFVLPSFFEGMPLTMIEALACGNKVVVTRLPGIEPFLCTQLPDAPVFYVTPPRMQETDVPMEEDLEVFERALADAIQRCVETKEYQVPCMGHMTWQHICKNILSHYEE